MFSQRFGSMKIPSTDIYQCIFDQISMTIMKNIQHSKYFRKICKNHQKIFDKKNSKKKKKVEKK